MFPDKRWRLFSLMGNPVYMTASFLIVMVLFAGMGVQTGSQLLVGLLWIPVLFIGILLHELGHALTSRALGYGHSDIVFWGLGGLAINRYKGRRSEKHNILISLAGPLTSGLIAVVSLGVLFALEGAFTSTGYFGKFWEIMVMANAFWAIFNVLPIYPMDGGQAMSSGLQIALKNRAKALHITGMISIGIILLTLCVSAFVFRQTPGLWLIFLAVYFGYLNFKMIKTKQTQSLY